MVTITYRRGGQTDSKKVHTWALAQTLTSFRQAGYTILNDGSAPAVETKAETPAATQAGRVGRGHQVHAIVEGHSKCGASYRRNALGATTRKVYLTGEAVTCRTCR